VPISDPRYERHIRRYDLARRMIGYEARTMTVSAWTGLTKYQIQRFFREYEGIGANTRHRGVPPSQASLFCRTLELECESSALAAVEIQMEVVPTETVLHLGESFVTLARGERLLDAFDLYRSLVPDARFSLEHALLLAKELAVGTTIALSHCGSCGGVMIVDILGRSQTDCAFCRMSRRTMLIAALAT
jgi:Flagellar transcriptional activator (FlhC)